MRADRLLSIMLMLQNRGCMSARELSGELEVSERTIYRDMDALSAAGVPVYGEPGPEGGFQLLDSYRTNLTGLTEGEIRALFMLNIPSLLADLGMSQELKAALIKLTAGLPDDQRLDEEQVRQRFHLDPTRWEQGEEQVPHLITIHQAVWSDRMLNITFHPHYAMEIEQLIDPYGLVSKAGVWYLVYARRDRVRVKRISDLLDAQISHETFNRSNDFDLRAFWEEWCDRYRIGRSNFKVLARISPPFIPLLPYFFGDQFQNRVDDAHPPDKYGWITLELYFRSFEAARDRILTFAGAVEVLEPYALRRSILDFASQTVELHS
jgi:predicted DNA-binding transcriptional regulator YafY